MNGDAGAEQRLHVVAMCLLALAFWVASRAYQGFYHDSQLYTLQALARLGPADGLAMDVFLRFGSQDRYTIFSSLYALAIDAWGVEAAARTLMIVGQLAWVAAAAYLASSVLVGHARWAGLALLAGLPGFYGAGEVFRFAEPFLTPRIFAEALVLLGLALGLRKRTLLAAAAMLLALALHPLMAAGGALCLACVALSPRYPWMVPAAVVAGLGAAVLVAVVAPVGPLRLFPPEWLALIRTRSEFLLISDWDAESWECVITTLVALYIAATTAGPDRILRLARAGLTASLLGLLVTWVGATLFHVVLLTQGQAWRWSWVGTVIAMLVAATQAPAAWRAGPVARTALLLFAAGSFLKGWFAVGLFVLAAAVWAIRNRPLPGSMGRAMFLGSVAVIATTALGWAGLHLTTWPYSSEASPHMWAIDPLNRKIADGIIPILLIILFFRAANARRFGRIMAAAGAVALAAMMLPSSIDWRRRFVPEELPQAGAEWRRVMAHDAEVLWPQNPIGTWIILDRRHYVSLVQSAGILFSEGTAAELMRRAQLTSLVNSPRMVFGGQGRSWMLNERAARSVCRAGGPDFIVAAGRLAFREAAPPERLPLPTTTRTTGSGWATHWLYSCAEVRNTPVQSPALAAGITAPADTPK
ncbi:MAG: hypothetical protein IT483_04995 [Gammaproteobacteria bacterium]|nr:hypothetical protein [Gammaproteobacteria bacterium]